jgi:hypothetical protein
VGLAVWGGPTGRRSRLQPFLGAGDLPEADAGRLQQPVLLDEPGRARDRLITSYDGTPTAYGAGLESHLESLAG